MKLALMQPYLLPYIGYFQLMTAVDQFVLYDDVQYMKGGWINRNRMLLNGRDALFTLSVRHGSFREKINERHWADHVSDAAGLMRKLAVAYGKAPYYAAAIPVIAEALAFSDDNVATGLARSIRVISSHLGISAPILVSSEIGTDASLAGQDRVLAVCERMKATTYINATGGRELYDRAAFSARGIELHFLEPKLHPYPQFGGEFIPGLSIVDALMFNPAERMGELLGGWALA